MKKKSKGLKKKISRSSISDNTITRRFSYSSCSSSSAMTLHSMKKGKKKKNKISECRFIFMCDGRTKLECYRFRVFGLPRANLDVVKETKRGSTLFLYDFDLKLLYGVYKAASNGTLDLDPTAFNGRFPAQVRFKTFKECLPLHESAFEVASRDNYQGSKFRQELSSTQVKGLISLFRPLTLATPTADVLHSSNVAIPRIIYVSDYGKRAPATL